MKIHSVYDNGGITFDRYTVYYKGRGSLEFQRGVQLRQMVGMSDHPFHPQGFGQHGLGMPGKHNGKKITFEELPPDCQKLVLQDLGTQKEPDITYLAEYTDTFGGEANYGWVRRKTFAAPSNASNSALLRRAKKALGLSGRFRLEYDTEWLRYNEPGMNCCLFIIAQEEVANVEN